MQHFVHYRNEWTGAAEPLKMRLSHPPERDANQLARKAGHDVLRMTTRNVYHVHQQQKAVKPSCHGLKPSVSQPLVEVLANRGHVFSDENKAALGAAMDKLAKAASAPLLLPRPASASASAASAGRKLRHDPAAGPPQHRHAPLPSKSRLVATTTNEDELQRREEDRGEAFARFKPSPAKGPASGDESAQGVIWFVPCQAVDVHSYVYAAEPASGGPRSRPRSACARSPMSSHLHSSGSGVEFHTRSPPRSKPAGPRAAPPRAAAATAAAASPSHEPPPSFEAGDSYRWPGRGEGGMGRGGRSLDEYEAARRSRASRERAHRRIEAWRSEQRGEGARREQDVEMWRKRGQPDGAASFGRGSIQVTRGAAALHRSAPRLVERLVGSAANARMQEQRSPSQAQHEQMMGDERTSLFISAKLREEDARTSRIAASLVKCAV